MTTEKMNVYEKVVELVKRQGRSYSIRNGIYGFVTPPKSLRKASKQCHHGEVHGALSNPYAGIDQHGTILAHEDIAIP